MPAEAALWDSPLLPLSLPPSPKLVRVPQMAAALALTSRLRVHWRGEGDQDNPIKYVWGPGLAHSWARTLLRQESRERNPSAAGMLWRQQLLLGFRCPLSSRGGWELGVQAAKGNFPYPEDGSQPLHSQADPGLGSETESTGNEVLTWAPKQ